MAFLYSEFFEKHYKIKLCSCIFLFWSVFAAFVLIMPYYAAYVSKGFWIKQDNYYEHPEVNFRNDLIIQFLGADGRSTSYSTVKEINDMSNHQMPPPLIKMRRSENSADDKMDHLRIDIEVKGNPQNVRNIQIHGTFDYKLSELLQIEMIGLMKVSVDTPNGAARLIVDGKLMLDQESPIQVESLVRKEYDVDPFAIDFYQKYTLNQIEDFYYSRNEKTIYDYQYLVQPLGSPYKTIIQVDIDIPITQQVLYIPGSLEVLKFAWIQYLAILIPCIFVFRHISSFLFRNQILDTTVESELQPRKRIF